MHDLTNILSTIAACAAKFIAIIAGLIANKVISVTAEKNAAQNSLIEIEDEYERNEEKISNLLEWIDNYDAEEFIDDNLQDLYDENL